MGGQNKKQQIEVKTPPPDAAELEARQKSNALIDFQVAEAGLERDPETGGYRRRALTPEEQQQKERDDQLMDLAYRKLTGQISDEDRALVEQEYAAAQQVGTSNIQAEFARQLEELNLGESRGYEDIKKAYAQDAQERGLQGTDSPILGEKAQSVMRFDQDILRNKRLLGEESLRQVGNLNTTLGGAKAASMLDTGYRQQIFAQGMREFQAQLQQNALMNRQNIANAFQQTALGLGNLRRRNYTQTSMGGGQGMNAAQGVGAAGGFISGIGSLFSSGAGGTSAISGMSGMFSSRKFKENIEPADLDHLLEKLESTPVYTWQYRGDSYKHIGPVTEEAPAEMVNGDVLVSIDYLGFLFGALKALNEKVKKLEAA